MKCGVRSSNCPNSTRTQGTGQVPSCGTQQEQLISVHHLFKAFFQYRPRSARDTDSASLDLRRNGPAQKANRPRGQSESRC